MSPEPLAPGFALVPRCPAAQAPLCSLPSSSTSPAAVGGRLQAGPARTPPLPLSRQPRPDEAGNGDRNLPGKTRSWAAESPNVAPCRVPAVPWGPSPARRALLDSAEQAPGPVPGPSRCPRGWRGRVAPQRQPPPPPAAGTHPSHVPTLSPPPTLPGADSSRPGDRPCPAHGEPPEIGAAAIACIASHNLLQGRSESPPH